MIIENYPSDQVEWVESENNPENPEMGTRLLPFSREIFIEQDDFMIDPPRKFFRLAPGREIRLKNAYIIKCEEVIKDETTGAVVELRCTYDPESRSGGATSGRKVKGTSHWVSVAHALDAQIRLYDHLFLAENPDSEEEGEDYKSKLNPRSLEILRDCKVEPGLAQAEPGNRFQFMRQGYFYLDPKAGGETGLVFNRIVALRDAWAKIQKGS